MSEKDHWKDKYDAREIAQIEHAVAYAEQFSRAGVPGHGQFILIAKLVKDLEDEIARNSAT